MEFEKIGKYKILGEIGQGAMGVVFRAHDPILNRYVAIKMISASLGADDELRKRFHREAQAAARLNHPNIITVFDFGEEHGRIYMAMELLEGSDLKDIMVAGSLQTLDDKLAVMEQILDGLAFAHSKEVVHRDLKPGNIHIQPNGQIKIMDFGLARLGSSEMTQAGVVMGTPNYMSPEQVLGEKVDARSDVFAMGAVLYELLSNHKPFEAESMHGVLFQVVHKEPQNIRKWSPDLPPLLIQIVDKCLIKDKTRRFQNAGEIREAVGIARQALAAGRVHEATLDMETGKVFFEAEEYAEVPEEEPPAAVPQPRAPEPSSKPRVEGTVVLQPAPQAAQAPAARVQPTLSGRDRTQMGPVSLPPMAAPSRAPLLIGGAVIVAAAVIGGILILRPRLMPGPTGPDPVVELLVETRNELAQGALDNKDYKKAIDAAEQTVSVAKSKSFPPEHKGLIQAEKILSEARTKFTAIESTASDAEDAFSKGELATAAEKLQALLELDSQHPVAKTLLPKLNQQFQQQVAEARRNMEQARDQAEKISSSAGAEYRAEGRSDIGKAGDAVVEAETALRGKAFAQATQKFLEARDAYDRGRRAIEGKMAEAAAKDAQLRAQLKIPAEEARTNVARARAAAEQAGAATIAAAASEFNGAVNLTGQAETAFGKGDFLESKKLFDQARSGFERSRTAALRTPPPTTTLPTVPTTTLPTVPTTTLPTVPTTTLPTVPTTTLAPAPPPLGPKVGRLEARGPERTNLRSLEGEDLTKKNPRPPEVVGTMVLEVSPASISVNETYTVKVFVTNTGSKPWKLKEIKVTTRVNRQAGPELPTRLKVTEVPPNERALVAETTGTWAEGVDVWVLEATVTTDKNDRCTNAVAFRKGP